MFLGSATQVFVRLAPGALLQALVHNDGQALPYSQGTPLSVQLPSDALRVLVAGDPKAGEKPGEVLRSDRHQGPGATQGVPEHRPPHEAVDDQMSAASN